MSKKKIKGGQFTVSGQQNMQGAYPVITHQTSKSIGANKPIIEALSSRPCSLAQDVVSDQTSAEGDMNPSTSPNLDIRTTIRPFSPMDSYTLLCQFCDQHHIYIPPTCGHDQLAFLTTLVKVNQTEKQRPFGESTEYKHLKNKINSTFNLQLTQSSLSRTSKTRDIVEKLLQKKEWLPSDINEAFRYYTLSQLDNSLTEALLSKQEAPNHYSERPVTKDEFPEFKDRPLSCDGDTFSHHLAGSQESSYTQYRELYFTSFPKQLDVQNSIGRTPLFNAAGNQSCDFLEKLIEMGQDVNVTDHTGKTPLFAAAENNSLECLQLLIEKVDDVNVTDKNGDSVFKICVQKLLNPVSDFTQTKEIIHFLLNKEDINLENLDSQTIEQLIETDPSSTLLLFKKVPNNQQVVLAAIQNCPDFDFSQIPEPLLSNPDIALAAIQNGLDFSRIPEQLLSENSSDSQTFAQNILKLKGPHTIIKFQDPLKSTLWAFALNECEPAPGQPPLFSSAPQHAQTLENFTGALRKDPRVFLQSPLKAEESFVEAAIKINGTFLKKASMKLKGNPNIVSAAVAQNHDAFQYADQCLKNDKKFVLSLISKSPRAIIHSSPSLKDNLQFVLQAINQNPSVLSYCSDTLIASIVSEKGKDFIFNQLQQISTEGDPHNVVDDLIVKALKVAVNEGQWKESTENQSQQILDILFAKRSSRPVTSTRVVERSKVQASYSHPVPVTIQPTGKEDTLLAATYGQYRPEEDGPVAFVYRDNLIAGSKQDIGSNIIQGLPQHLQESFSQYLADTQYTDKEKFIAYEALYVFARLDPKHKQIFSTTSKPNTIQSFLEEFHFLKQHNPEIKIACHKFKHTKTYGDLRISLRPQLYMEAKLVEQRKKVEEGISGTSKHQIATLLGQTKKENLIQKLSKPEESSDPKKELLLFLIDNHKKIDDFEWLLFKLSQKTPQELATYLEKSATLQDKDQPKIKGFLNEAFTNKRPIGLQVETDSMETLKCSYKDVKETDEGQFLTELTEYLPPSIFGTLQCDPKIKQEIVDMWENINSPIESVKNEAIQQLCALCQNHPQYMIHFVAKITSQLDDTSSQLVWNSMAQSITHLPDVQKNQIGHFLLSKLIIQNREQSFQSNYVMLQEAFNTCDWPHIKKQAFQKSFGGGGRNFPDLTLAFNTRNVIATKFFIEAYLQDPKIFDHSKSRQDKAIYRIIFHQILNPGDSFTKTGAFINSLHLDTDTLKSLQSIYSSL